MNSETSGLTSVIEDWESLNKDFAELESLQKEYSKAAGKVKKLENDCRLKISHHTRGIYRILETLQCSRMTSEKEKVQQSSLKKEIAYRKQELEEIRSTLPKNNGIYLRIVLGNINVSFLNEETKYKYKDEYEKFKLTVTMIILVLSFLNIIFSYRALDAIHHFLLVWYYCTLTIRESILVVNGSRIKGWWRAHHFITMTLAGVLILWPDGKSYQLFRTQFMWYIGYVSFLQFLQYNYQQGCLYRLRALGERYNMDITVDGFHSWMWRGLKFLLPFLAIGYFWQLYNAYVLFEICKNADFCDWQVAAASVIYLILFTGNTLTTSIIVHQKLNLKALILKKLK